jgi:hypothetical protein
MPFADQLLAERQSSHAFAATSRSPGEKLLQCTCSLFVLGTMSVCVRLFLGLSMVVCAPDPTRWELKRKWRQAKQNRIQLQQVCSAKPQFGPSELTAAAKTIKAKLQVCWQTSLCLSHLAGVLLCTCVGLSPRIRIPWHAVLEWRDSESLYHETATTCNGGAQGNIQTETSSIPAKTSLQPVDYSVSSLVHLRLKVLRMASIDRV